jgi:hypothetical protein
LSLASKYANHPRMFIKLHGWFLFLFSFCMNQKVLFCLPHCSTSTKNIKYIVETTIIKKRHSMRIIKYIYAVNIVSIKKRWGQKKHPVCRLTNHQIYYCFCLWKISFRRISKLRNLILNKNVSIHIYVLLGYVIKLDKKNRRPKPKKNSEIRICATVVWIYSNVVVSIDSISDEFALLRRDSYQLTLLISWEWFISSGEKKCWNHLIFFEI